MPTASPHIKNPETALQATIRSQTCFAHCFTRCPFANLFSYWPVLWYFSEVTAKIKTGLATQTLFCVKNNDVKIFALLESAWNFLHNLYNVTHLTLGMLLHYLGKLKIQIFCQYSADMEKCKQICILIASNFLIHPQILIVFVFKIAIFPILISNKFFHVTVFYLFTFTINL